MLLLIFMIYDLPEPSNKHFIWSLMSSLKSSYHVPFIMFGDFNKVASLTEKGGAPTCEQFMDDFEGL